MHRQLRSPHRSGKSWALLGLGVLVGASLLVSAVDPPYSPPGSEPSNVVLAWHTFEIEFKERGLPPHTAWSVNLGSDPEEGNGSDLTFKVPNGTYTFATTATGYTASPTDGQVTMHGRYVSVAVTFAAAPTPSNYIHHVVVIVLENSNLSRILSGGPADFYQAYLEQAYGRVPDYYAVCHSSPPNYIALVSGHTDACQGNVTQHHVINVTNLPDDLEAHNLSWAGYFESMPTPCDRDRGTIYYGWLHDPFIDLEDIVDNSSRCDAHVVNSAAFNASIANGSLPTFSYYVPNQLDDCHNSTQRFCDDWLRGFLSPLLNATAPAEAALVRHTAFFVVYDEGDYQGQDAGFNVSGVTTGYCQRLYHVPMSACGGNTYAVAISPYSDGTEYAADATDMDLTSTFEWLLGLPSDGGYDGGVDFPAMASLFSFP
jgi:hypothetical protein